MEDFQVVLWSKLENGTPKLRRNFKIIPHSIHVKYLRNDSKYKIKSFQKLIKSYFTDRKQLISAFVLIDIRHAPQKIDLDFIYWLGEIKIPFSIIFTKSDKIKFEKIEDKVNLYLQELSNQWSFLPKYFISSANNRSGINKILGYINEMNNL